MNKIEDVIELLKSIPRQGEYGNSVIWVANSQREAAAAIAFLRTLLPARTEAIAPAGICITTYPPKYMPLPSTDPDPVAERYREYYAENESLCDTAFIGTDPNGQIWGIAYLAIMPEGTTDIRRIVRNPDGSVDFVKE